MLGIDDVYGVCGLAGLATYYHVHNFVVEAQAPSCVRVFDACKSQAGTTPANVLGYMANMQLTQTRKRRLIIMICSKNNKSR